MYFTHTHAGMNMAAFLGTPNQMFAVAFDQFPATSSSIWICCPDPSQPMRDF